MTERERLIGLLTEAHEHWLKYVDDCAFNQVALSFTFEQLFADHLLANGVIVPPCKVGDTVCNARELAITAIGKQIPIKPIGRHTSYKCPVCGRRVRSGKGSSSRGVDHFCQRCGQALDWGDTE